MKTKYMLKKYKSIIVKKIIPLKLSDDDIISLWRSLFVKVVEGVVMKINNFMNNILHTYDPMHIITHLPCHNLKK